MAKWEISKSFDFCYGHRVHTQVLDTELSCNSKCKCRHQHGHQGLLNVYLEGVSLNEQGMVLDFVNLNWLKKWIDDILDHKMILDISDPMVPKMYPILKNFLQDWGAEGTQSLIEHFTSTEDYFYINPELYEHLTTEEQEIYSGLVFVPFVPTSENLSKWLYEIIERKLQGIAVVSKVEFFETPKSKSVYYGI